jgi:hypothetical protein
MGWYKMCAIGSGPIFTDMYGKDWGAGIEKELPAIRGE